MIYFYFLAASALASWISRRILALQASGQAVLAESHLPSIKIRAGLLVVIAGAGILCAFWMPLIAFSIVGNEQAPFEVTVAYGVGFVVFLWLWIAAYPIRKYERPINTARSPVRDLILRIPLTVRILLFGLFVIGVVVLKNLSYSGKMLMSRGGAESGISGAPHK